MRLVELFVLAVALSMDAFAVSFCKGLSTKDPKARHALCVGFWIGHVFGLRYKKGAEITGGTILILLGCKILLEHLGLFPF